MLVCALEFHIGNKHPPFVYHFLDDFPQSASFDVLCDEVESLVFVEDSDELEHIGVIQASHDFHLKDTNNYLFSHISGKSPQQL